MIFPALHPCREARGSRALQRPWRALSVTMGERGQGWKQGGIRAECLQRRESKLALFKSGEREIDRQTHAILKGSYNLNFQSSVLTLEFICIYLLCASMTLSSFTSFTCLFSSFLTWSGKDGASGGRI